MKKAIIARLSLIFLVLLIPLIAGGCPPGNYMGYYEDGYDDPYNSYGGPPLIRDTVVDIYLRVLDPLGYAVPGCEVEIIFGGHHYKTYQETSGQFHPINNAFPGEWANFNDAFNVEVNRYRGARVYFDVEVRRWGFMTARRQYEISYLDTDSIYMFFDEIVMYR